jgi:hypothetical protein
MRLFNLINSSSIKLKMDKTKLKNKNQITNQFKLILTNLKRETIRYQNKITLMIFLERKTGLQLEAIITIK